MAYANDHWMGLPETLRRAGGGGGATPLGGIKDPSPTSVSTRTPIVRFGGKEFDPVLGSHHDRIVFGQKVSGHGGWAMHGGHGLFGSARYGEWWLALTEFNKVERFAARTGVSVGKAVRQLCFIPREWSDVGTLIQGDLVKPLAAYTGVGNPLVAAIGSGGQRRDYPARTGPDEQVVQLFIPGLGDYDFNRDTFMPTRSALLATAAD